MATPQSDVQIKALMPPDKEGHMTKQGGSVKTWKRRYFILKGNSLYYFKQNKPETEAQGQIDIASNSFVKQEEKKGKKHAFAVGTARRVFYMYADTEGESNAWMAAIQSTIDRLSKGGIPSYSTNTNSGSTTSSPSGVSLPASAKDVRNALLAAKNEIYFLKENQSMDNKVLDFWKIWTESIPPHSELLLSGGSIQFDVATSADMQRFTWRTSGPQSIFIQNMVNFFWNVGAPESEIDRLNDVGGIINPLVIGSWIDMSAKGGMDGGWFFPVDTALKIANEANDTGDAAKKVLEWADKHMVQQCYALGRDMGAAPPRQTELKIKLPGTTFQEQLTIAKSAFDTFGFPALPEEAITIISATPKLGLRMSIITSSEGFVRLGLLVPEPDGSMIDKLCPMSGALSSQPLVKFASAIGNTGPQFVEFQYLMKGFGYGVYKEGFDVVFHYNIGTEGR